MSKKYDEIIENIAKLNETKGKASQLVQDDVSAFIDVSASIRLDTSLSGRGHLEKIDEVKKASEQHFLQGARYLNNVYRSLKQKTLPAVRDFLASDPEAPDETTQKEFKKGLSKLKMDVLLADRPSTVLDKIKSFTYQVSSHPWTANELLKELPELTGRALSTASSDNDAKAAKHSLSQLVDHTRKAAMTEEQQKLSKIYEEQLKPAEKAPLFEDATLLPIRNTFGPMTVYQANHTEENE